MRTRSRASVVIIGHVGGDRQRLADVLELVLLLAVEEVHGHDERHAVALHVVDRREAVGQPAGVDEDDGADGPSHQVVPHELEPVLAGGAEQVEHQVVAEGDAAEVHGHGGRGLAGVGATGLVDALGDLGHGRLGRQRGDLGDGADEGRLPDGEAAGDDDLDRQRGRAVGAVRGGRWRQRDWRPSRTLSSSWRSGTIAGPGVIGGGGGEQPLLGHVADEDADDTEGEMEVGGDLGDGDGTGDSGR